MKEYSIKLRDELKFGLRNDVRSGKNKAELSFLRGLRPDSSGLVANLRSERILDELGDINFPFPQVFKFNRTTIVATLDALYYYDDIGEVLTPIVCYSVDDTDVEEEIVGNGLWHFADMHDSWMLTNGENAVFLVPFSKFVANGVDKVLLTRNIVNTCCYYKGRLITGGFCEDDVYPVFNPLKPGDYRYSAIGGGDCFTDFVPSLRYNIYREDTKRNDSGFATALGRGNVVCVKKLGEYLVVYSTESVVAYQMVLAPDSVLGGKIIELENGPVNRSAVGGDENEHIYLDKNRCLWRLDGNLKLKRHGYEEFFEAFDECADISILLSPTDSKDQGRNYYISDGYRSFLLSNNGLSESSIIHTAISKFIQGKLYGTFSGVDSTFELITDVIDIELRAFKMLEFVEVGYSNITNLRSEVLASYDNGVTFKSFGLRLHNSEGFANHHVSAPDFKIRLTGDINKNSVVSHLTMRWKLDDKRSIRSPYDAS